MTHNANCTWAVIIPPTGLQVDACNSNVL